MYCWNLVQTVGIRICLNNVDTACLGDESQTCKTLQLVSLTTWPSWNTLTEQDSIVGNKANLLK